MVCGIQVVSKPLFDWEVDDLMDFLWENGTRLTPDNLQEIAQDMVMVSHEVRKIYERADHREVEEATGRVHDLEREVDNLEEDIIADQEEILSLEREKETLEASVSRLEDDVEDYKKHLKDADQEIGNLENCISSLEKEIEILRNTPQSER